MGQLTTIEGINVNTHERGRAAAGTATRPVASTTKRQATSHSTPTSARTVEVLPEDDFYTVTISRRQVLDAVVGTLCVTGFLAFIILGVVLGIAAGTAGVIVSLAAGVLAIMVVNAEQRRRGHER